MIYVPQFYAHLFRCAFSTQPTEKKMNNEQIARITHEVNRAYCASIGDHSQPAWEDAPQWQKDSALMGVEANRVGNPSPEENHISWMKQKEAEGWKYGAYKDPENKLHPCMVPYANLPVEQRTKDHLFRAVVRAALGKTI